jgi:16S rRNA (cytosine967-C5)-methyltransferase
MLDDPRLNAVRLLYDLLSSKNEILALSPNAKALFFYACRNYFKLEALALQLLKNKPKDLEVWCVLILGISELIEGVSPDYAIVKAYVDIVHILKKSSAKALVNAVLRNFCRRRTELRDLDLPTHPKWFIDLLKQYWPNNYQDILQANDAQASMTLRVNRQKISRDAYLAKLHNARPCAFSEDGVILAHPCEVKDLPGFLQGECAVQDEAAQLAVNFLHLQDNLKILDAAAAPGGKTCHILERYPNIDCTAVDISELRIKRIHENLHRLGLRARVLQQDLSNLDESFNKLRFDRILLDAPCSATGVIRRHPDIKLARSFADIVSIMQTQEKILSSLWPLLNPNGMLLYVTCSILPLENTLQIRKFLTKTPDCKVYNIKNHYGELDELGGVQILPGSYGMDGFYYCLLQKNSKS